VLDTLCPIRTVVSNVPWFSLLLLSRSAHPPYILPPRTVRLTPYYSPSRSAHSLQSFLLARSGSLPIFAIWFTPYYSPSDRLTPATTLSSCTMWFTPYNHDLAHFLCVRQQVASPRDRGLSVVAYDTELSFFKHPVDRYGSYGDVSTNPLDMQYVTLHQRQSSYFALAPNFPEVLTFRLVRVR
jgi:hypothetical protein